MFKRYFKTVFFILVTTSFLLILSTCKKDGPQNAEDTYQKLANIMNIQEEAGKIFQDTFNFTKDKLRGLYAIGRFLSENPAVESAFYLDEDLIEINYNNGLSSSISLYEVDDMGNYLNRGSGNTGILRKFSGSGGTENIKNERVLVLNPHLKEFAYPGGNYTGYLNYFEGGDVELKVEHYDEHQVKLSHINNMDQYGFVIINTHGQRNSFELYELVKVNNPGQNEPWTTVKVSELIKNTDNIADAILENGELKVTTALLFKNNEQFKDLSFSISVTDDYIRNSNLDLKDVVVFGNHCYSGYANPFYAGDNMVDAWKSKNVGTYYGYAFDNLVSIGIDNEFCRNSEAILIQRLAQKNDTTGIANYTFSSGILKDTVYVRPDILNLNVADFKEFQKFSRAVARGGGSVPVYLNLTRFLAGNLKWGCPDFLIDERDSQKYDVVCIGKQTWMAQNLNYPSSNSLCFKNDPNICKNFGRLYPKQDIFGKDAPVRRDADKGVQGVCPQGWHVPSHKEWMELEVFLGMPLSEADEIIGSGAHNRGANQNVGEKLKSRTNWLTAPNSNTNSSGFTLKPAGIGSSPTFFNGTGLNTSVWSASLGAQTGGVTSIIIRLLTDNLSGISISDYPFEIDPPGENTIYASCRCIKD